MTQSSEDLDALLVRVEAATGPDRELDLAVLLACGCTQTQTPPFEIVCWPDGFRIWLSGSLCDRIKITASLDAALALCERVLPGRGVDILITPGFSSATIRPPRYTDDEPDANRAKTPALALLAAMLKAIIASASTEKEG